ncbi:NAD(P)/FAD-dependent oxidoreductase [Caulobacter sp. CCH9-E1]|uniref:flavin-containing monooxygenase n=1 Tax=Caulobacter sp. CCH9-E1 TaxID=1768768 RepID=UPI000831BEE1|nr:NAD(P)/FAD-dependent oxidoreductase [Caulobacter sp. CCH9-E1]
MQKYDVLVVGGGQSGLAAGWALLKTGLKFAILEGGAAVAGSWPRYYDSLRLFSPAAYSALPDRAFPGDPKRYPRRDEVSAYLANYADALSLPVLTGQRVTSVERTPEGFWLRTTAGREYVARSVVIATGVFEAPHMPRLPGHERFGGMGLHVAGYRNPEPYRGRRVVVVGAANSAVQVAVELAAEADVTLAVRSRVRFIPQTLLGRDIHFWFNLAGVDRSRRLSDQGTPVLDDGHYSAALKRGAPLAKPMFTSFTETGVVWADGVEERIDAVIFATGYRPNVGFTKLPGLVDGAGTLLQRDGRAIGQPGIYFVGQPGLRSFSSGVLRGVGRDAAAVAAQIRRVMT